MKSTEADRPAYFETIRSNAAQRWDQLEADPELAGPWHTLFKQVQYPRHVLSELMQNADDAGATEVAVRIEDGTFIFEHNGEDFQEAHFASLCRFAYSNKRNMHTIGFRGIGFKSTFSLGSEVYLYTPKLAVKFTQERFTEPVWLPEAPDTQGKTRICVEVRDGQAELRSNLEIWKESPFSLLFFNNLRSLRIGSETVPWSSSGEGPVRGSQWMTPSLSPETSATRYLLIKSEAEAFPENAMQEIRKERRMSPSDEDFPPCQVEIVLGAEGRLYVVLPTNVKTALPFAVNAPFIQDPGRLEIKDPSISATNRWLLLRVGRLAAKAMLAWLAREDLPLEERARAYDLVPPVANPAGSLGEQCARLIRQAFVSTIEGKPIILTDTGKLVYSQEAVALPKAVLDVWGERTASMFSPHAKYALYRAISRDNLRQMKQLGVIEEVGRDAIFETLRNQRLPKPASWQKLVSLWGYVSREGKATPHPTRYTSTKFHRATSSRERLEELHIVPVAQQAHLEAIDSVVRSGSKTPLQSEEDWAFLTTFVNIVDRTWIAYLPEQIEAAEQEDAQLSASQVKELDGAYNLYRQFRLDQAESANGIVSKVADAFFVEPRPRDQYVRFAHIAAKLGANVAKDFYFVTRDDRVRGTEDYLFFDRDGELAELLTPRDRDRLLHDDYTREFTSCSAEEWQEWVASRRAGLNTFVPLEPMAYEVPSQQEAQEIVETRGYGGALEPTYKKPTFAIEDYDFREELWEHWQQLAEDDTYFWVLITKRILEQDQSFWRNSMSMRLLEQHNRSVQRRLVSGSDGVAAAWVMRLRNLRCLTDRKSRPQKPDALHRLTRATEAFLDVENFIHSDLEKFLLIPLLDSLGVHSKPPSPERILSILRGFASQADPKPKIIREVEKWYTQLDDTIENGSPKDRDVVRDAFRKHPLVLAQDGSWCESDKVFLESSDGIPGFALVRESLKDLALWRQIGVAERPSLDTVMDWLQRLPSKSTLSPDDATRVRGVLKRYPRDVWERCAHWLSLTDAWMPLDTLKFALAPASEVPWQSLLGDVKAQTADMRELTSDIVRNPPFGRLPTLTSQLEQRLHNRSSLVLNADHKSWLAAFGKHLSRLVIPDNEAETARIRKLATRLAKTTWYDTHKFKVTPYLGSTPAGLPTAKDLLWQDTSLYVTNLPGPKLAQRLPDVLASEFNNRDIRAALFYSFERRPEDVREYLETNFTLEDLSATPTPPADTPLAGVKDFETSSETRARGERLSVQVEGDTAYLGEEAPLTPDAPDTPSALDTPDMSSDEERSEPSIDTDMATKTNAKRYPERLAPNTRNKLVARFARAHGYHPVSSDGLRFKREEDGSLLLHNGNSDLFAWELQDATGEAVRWYRPEVQHLEDDEGVEIPAEVWNVLSGENSDRYALILLDANKRPIGISGSELLKKVKVYSASYRLVLKP